MLYQNLVKHVKKYRKTILFAKVEYCIYYFYTLKFYRKRQQWVELQHIFLSQILNYAKIHSPYYSRILKDQVIIPNNADTVLKQIPLSNKDLINKEKYNIYSDEIGKDWSNWTNTGGSTGDPLYFPSMHTAMPLEGIHEMMLYRLMKINIFDVIVSIDGSRIEEKKLKEHIYYSGMQSAMYGKYHFSTLYMNDETLGYYIQSLNKINPNIMRGYPSGFLELCKFIRYHNAHISFKLKGIYLTSEYFSEEDAVFIEETLNCPVYGQYGHTEMAVFAIKLPKQSSYECYPLYGVTEILHDGKQVEIGEIGEIYTTSFSQKGVPFIRYATGDLAVYGGKKADGTIILSSLYGRTRDYIFNKKNEKVYLVGFIFGGHINAFKEIKNWQLIQTEIGKVEIKLVKGQGYSENTEVEIRELFIKHDIEIQFNYCQSIERTLRGKQRFLIQNVTLS